MYYKTTIDDIHIGMEVHKPGMYGEDIFIVTEVNRKEGWFRYEYDRTVWKEFPIYTNDCTVSFAVEEKEDGT